MLVSEIHIETKSCTVVASKRNNLEGMSVNSPIEKVPHVFPKVHASAAPADLPGQRRDTIGMQQNITKYKQQALRTFQKNKYALSLRNMANNMMAFVDDIQRECLVNTTQCQCVRHGCVVRVVTIAGVKTNTLPALSPDLWAFLKLGNAPHPLSFKFPAMTELQSPEAHVPMLLPLS